VGRLFWKTCAGTVPSLRCTGRLQRSVLIKNGRSWRKHLSMSVSRERSSKDTSLFRGGTRQRLPKAVKGNKVKRSQTKRARTFDGFTCRLTATKFIASLSFVIWTSGLDDNRSVHRKRNEDNGRIDQVRLCGYLASSTKSGP